MQDEDSTPDDRVSMQLAKALELAELGYYVAPMRVIPKEDGGKTSIPTVKGDWKLHTSNDPSQIVKMRWDAPDVLPAIDTEKSGVAVVDLDVKNGVDGKGTWSGLMMDYPGTPTPRPLPTRSGGLHLYFYDPDTTIKNTQGTHTGLPGVDTRGKGGLIYVYEQLPPAPEDLPPVPGWLADAIGQGPHLEIVASNGVSTITDRRTLKELRDMYRGMKKNEGRNETLTRIAGYLALKTNDRDEFAALVHADNAKAADPLDRDEVEVIISSIYRREQAKDVGGTLADGYRDTDVGNSHRLVEMFADRIRFVPLWDKWLVFEGGRWVLDVSGYLMIELAKQVTRDLFQQSIDLPKDDRAKMYAHAKRSEHSARLEAMVYLARGAEGIPVNHEQLDTKPDLMNFLNGTMDLATGEFRPHDPKDLLTKQIPYNYDPQAIAPTWEQCLRQWQPDEEVRRYLQKVAGACASGYPVEHLFINLGTGSNGKSKFWGALQGALGPYAVEIDKSLLVVTKHQKHDTIFASLFRARLALASETEESDKLNEAQIKDLTGGDRIKARRMREDDWEFNPTHTVVLHTNHPPRIRGTDEAIWRRVRLIPWNVRIPQEERDPFLSYRLAEEYEGILAWIVRGARLWYEEGFTHEPPSVAQSTEEYKEENNTAHRFFKSIGLRYEPGGKVFVPDLKQMYEDWCEDEGIRPYWTLIVDGLVAMGAVSGRAKRFGTQVRAWKDVAIH